MNRLPLRQDGGDNSSNFQAAGDIHLHGLDADEARNVALEVFRSNAIELAGVAQAVAVARAEELTNEFLRKLQEDAPSKIDSLSDPDMQSSVFEAQKAFARSGEEDLRVALVDLLAARGAEQARNLRTLALNEAIVSAPKLTEGQRRAIGWVFYIRYCRDTASGNPDQFYARLSEVASALDMGIPSGAADYQHIEYVGAGSVGLGSHSLGDGLLSGAEGIFTHGFERAAVEDGLFARLDARNFIVPAVRNSENFQINLVADEDLSANLAALGLQADEDAVRPLLSSGRMGAEEVGDEAVARVPALAQLRSVWDDDQSSIRRLTLTSVGLAIGHAYWSRLTGREAPLAIWLP